MPFLSNEEIRTAPPGYEPAKIGADGTCAGPRCCGQPMNDAGGCSDGCCDDYRCSACGHKVRIEWPS
jgi:hypothetical protein